MKHALLRVGETLGRSPLRARLTEGALLSYDGELLLLESEATLARARAGDAGDAGTPPPAPRVLMIVDRQPGGLAGIYAAGPGTFLDEIVTLAGGENALARSPVAYSSLAAEHVVALAPDVIIEVGPAVDETRARADWAALSSVPAVKTGRVHALAEPALLAPTPRTPGVAARRVVPLLWPPPSPR